MTASCGTAALAVAAGFAWVAVIAGALLSLQLVTLSIVAGVAVIAAGVAVINYGAAIIVKLRYLSMQMA